MLAEYDSLPAVAVVAASGDSVEGLSTRILAVVVAAAAAAAAAAS